MKYNQAVALLTENLHSDRAQIRKNALTAVIAAQIEDCYKDLVRIAVNDPDESVRVRAREEMAFAGSQMAGEYVSALQELIGTGENPLGIYRLVGQVRARGSAISLPIPLSKKLKLTIDERFTRQAEVPGIGWLGLFGGGIGFVAAALYIGIVSRIAGISSKTSLSLLIGALLPGVLVQLARKWWRPIQEQASRLSAVLADMAALSLLGAMAAAGSIAFVSIDDHYKHLPSSSVKIAILSGALSFCAVRAGMLASHGTVRRPLVTRFLQVLTGIAAGLSTLAGVAITVGNADDPVMSAVSLMFVPVIFGLSMALARVDSESYSRFPVNRVIGRFARLVTLALTLSFLVIALIPLLPPRLPAVTQNSKQGRTNITIPIDHLPYNQLLVLESPQKIHAQFQDERSYAGALEIQISSASSNGTGLAQPQVPLINDQALGAGSYRIQVTRAGGTARRPDPGEILSLVLKRIRHGLRTARESTLVLDENPPN